MRERLRSFVLGLVDASRLEFLAISVVAILASVVVGGVLLVVSGLFATCTEAWLSLGGATLCYDPFNTFELLFVRSLTDPTNLVLTLRELTLLLFAGLSVAVAFRSGLFNIGSQGQMVLGSIAATVTLLAIAPLVPGGTVGSAVLLPTGLLVGGIVGGLYGAIPGVLKVYGDANEVITTIMLNAIATNVAYFLVTAYFQNPDSQLTETSPLPDAATFTPIIADRRGDFSVLALLAALALLAGVFYLLTYTRPGYDFRISGLQSKAAEYAGVNAAATTVASMALSGALAGVGGAVWAMMVYGGWSPGMASYGFDGITVSILAGNNPAGVLPAAALFGMLNSGSVAIEFATDVPRELVAVIRGLVILFIAMPAFFRAFGERLVGVSDA